MVDYIIKLIIVGDSLTGKSSLLKMACEKKFIHYYEATIGVDFLTKINKMADGKVIKTHIWDTAGQKCFSNIIKSYYKGTAGIIYVFNKNKRVSFDNIKYWMDEVYENSDNNIPLMLIGNQIDKVCNVSSEEASRFASKHGMLYMETSAKKGINTEEFLDIFITNIYNNKDENSIGIRESYQSSISVKNKEEDEEKLCCCSVS